MKPFHRLVIGILAGAAGGFIMAWQLKPAVGNPESAADIPLRTRMERRPTTTHPLGKPAPSAFSLRWEELEDDEDGEQKREGLLAALSADDFPQLLAEISGKAGLTGLGYEENEQLEEVFKVWHAKAPEAALGWLRSLPKAEDREGLLHAIVEEAAETDLDAALAILSQNGRDKDGRISVPDKVLEKAANLGAEKLLEVCKLGLGRSRDGTYDRELGRYPTDFDFKLVLDGLAAAAVELGEDGSFARVPGNLLSEWAKRDLQAAWAWSREGKTVSGNEMSSLIAVTSPAAAIRKMVTIKKTELFLD